MRLKANKSILVVATLLLLELICCVGFGFSAMPAGRCTVVQSPGDSGRLTIGIPDSDLESRSGVGGEVM